MEYYLGVDIGTTSVKTIAFSREGIALFEESISYPIRHPFPSWSEQDPEEISTAVLQTVEFILQKTSPHIPQLCCFSSAMHSLIAVDKNGMALSPSIIWADNRAADIAREIHAQNRAKEFYMRTGLPVHAMSPFCKLLWIKKNQPDIFYSADKFIGIKEYVFFKLFGCYCVDVSIAAATGFMNGETLQWDPWILEQAGISELMLSGIVESEKTFLSPSRFSSLEKVPFIIGGSDGAMANIGAGDEPSCLVITVGTSSAARMFVNKQQLDNQMRGFCYYLTKDKWLFGGAGNNGGIVLQWLQEEFFRANGNRNDFINEASKAAPGSDGLIFLPYLLGERAPVWNADAKGVLFGLNIHHTQASMIRSSLEGVVFCLYAISQPMLEKAAIDKIHATGGFARNELWLQILADIFDRPVYVGETIESSAWGAAKWGMNALGIPVSKSENVNRIYTPDKNTRLIYSEAFTKFQRLYDLLREEFTK